MGISRGTVLQIQRMSTEDGPGLRSTAFLKGCPLACAWCHNPESISGKAELQWIGLRCIAASTSDGCGACLAACPEKALSRGADGALSIDRGKCAAGEGCEACARACPGGALELLGKSMTASELTAELLKDRAYFERSDRGGVTLSGGEASTQGGFSREVLRLLSEAGVHTALDTCGYAPWDKLSALYPHVNLLLWDLKEADPGRHRAFTGRDNQLVLENLARTAAYMGEHSRPEAIWIRTPVIPGATDTEENLRGLGLLLARLAPPRLERWELCAFNNLCADKYTRLGRVWSFAKAPLMSGLDMARLAAAAREGLASGGIENGEGNGKTRLAPSSLVSWTGSVRIEPERN